MAGFGLVYAIGCGKVKTTEIQFQCMPWERPKGGADCEKCNKDPLKQCTRYRCESLGARCTLINENTGEDKCVSIESEGTIPIITPWDEILDKSLYSYQDVSTNGFRVRTKDNECIQAFTPLVFGVKTDIFSQCNWDLEAIEFENMANTFLEGNLFSKNHTLVTVLPSVDSIIASESNPGEGVEDSDYQYILDKVGDLNIYVKCANIDGVSNDVDYRINFCIDPGPDLTPPAVVATMPIQNQIVSFISTSQDAVFFISEPAECRWDVTRPTGNSLSSYNSLKNSMDCNTDAEDVTILGYLCNATLPITQENNKFYILCRDQPWLQEDNSRNIGNVFEYILKKSTSELKIDEISPSGTIFAGTEPITIEIKVKTSGGANNGESICEYGFDPENYIDEFLETNSDNHRQILNQMVSGDYKLYVRCTDSAGNIAIGNKEFKLELDSQYPSVTRVFSSGGNLVLITDENATCYYRNDSQQCGFSFDNSTQFQPGNSKIHSTNWNTEEIYYVKCKDSWNNQLGQCSIIVKPYEILN